MWRYEFPKNILERIELETREEDSRIFGNETWHNAALFLSICSTIQTLNQCDLWIIFDTPHYPRKTWINRNRIINKDKSWSYISVPIIKGSSTKSNFKTKIAEKECRKEIFNRLKVY